MDWRYLLLSFEGRINRKPYLLTALGLGIVSSIVFSVIMALFGTFTASDVPGASTMEFSPIGWALLVIFYAAFLWCAVALAVKRLHDRNRSGWFYLLLLVPFVNIWIAIEILFLRGTEGANRFGPDPLGGR